MSDEPDETPTERAADPLARVIEKATELRSHAELAAIFEAGRKFEAQLLPGLDADVARQVQRVMARAEKSREGNSPLVGDAVAADAAAVLRLPADRDLTTNDYHVYRRPGEVMLVRWLAGDEVDLFYERLQAHFDAGLNGLRADERQANEWKGEPATLMYLDALDKLEVDLAERYLRDVVKTHGIVALSTQTADEMNIAFLCDHLMGLPAAELVGARSAPSEEPTEAELSWFFKLFLLRGMDADVERICIFAFLQKTDDWSDDEDE